MKLVASLMFAAALPFSAFAEGNLARPPSTPLPTLELKGDGTMSQAEYHIETGKYYRLDITSDGKEEMAWFAPELFRNSWVNQVVVNGLEIKAFGFYSLEFDDAGTFRIMFLPIRPGTYPFWVAGFEDKGMTGAFIVK